MQYILKTLVPNLEESHPGYWKEDNLMAKKYSIDVGQPGISSKQSK